MVLANCTRYFLRRNQRNWSQWLTFVLPNRLDDALFYWHQYHANSTIIMSNDRTHTTGFSYAQLFFNFAFIDLPDDTIYTLPLLCKVKMWMHILIISLCSTARSIIYFCLATPPDIYTAYAGLQLWSKKRHPLITDHYVT
jgi:hypothetical protein